MKDKIKEICNKLNREQLSVYGATEELLLLFSVVEQSEQYCDCQEIIVADYIDNKHCSQCNKPMDSL